MSPKIKCEGFLCLIYLPNNKKTKIKPWATKTSSGVLWILKSGKEKSGKKLILKDIRISLAQFDL